MRACLCGPLQLDAAASETRQPALVRRIFNAHYYR